MMFIFKIREEEVGVADSTYKVLVHALHLKDARRKLKNHLENFYENKIYIEELTEHFRISFTTNGGFLLVTWKAKETIS
jgi:hypothetical protein